MAELLGKGFEVKAALATRLGEALILQRGRDLYRCSYMMIDEKPLAIVAKCFRISPSE